MLCSFSNACDGSIRTDVRRFRGEISFPNTSRSLCGSYFMRLLSRYLILWSWCVLTREIYGAAKNPCRLDAMEESVVKIWRAERFVGKLRSENPPKKKITVLVAILCTLHSYIIISLLASYPSTYLWSKFLISSSPYIIVLRFPDANFV